MRSFLILALGVVITSCNSESSTEPLTTEEAAAVGKYSLVLVNNSDLPANAGTTSGLCLRSVESGSLELGTNHRFALLLQMRAACANTITGNVEATGKWSVTSGVLTLTAEGGPNMHPSAVALSGKVVTLSVQFDWQGQTPTLALRLTK